MGKSFHKQKLLQNNLYLWDQPVSYTHLDVYKRQGKGVDTALTAATINTGTLGVFHGMKSYFCQDEYGQIAPVYSISAGLDYPGTVSYTHLTTQGESDIELLHRYNSKHFIEVAIDCENKQNNDMKSLKDIALDMMKDSIQLNKNNEHID